MFTAPRAETERPGLAVATRPALVLGAGHHHLSYRPGNAPEGKPKSPTLAQFTRCLPRGVAFRGAGSEKVRQTRKALQKSESGTEVAQRRFLEAKFEAVFGGKKRGSRGK